MGALLGGLLGKLIRSEAGFVLLVFLAWVLILLPLRVGAELWSSTNSIS